MREHIVINSDRSVTVPDSLKKIGIQYDHNVNTLTFDCPRYADDAQSIDMSKMQIFINWMLPDKSIGCSIAENIIIDEADSTLMHFDWIITSAVTPVFGILERTLVCIKQTDTDGREIYHWNTDLFQKFSVGEGMECNEQLAEENMDVITQLLVKMDAVDTRTSTEAMRSYVSEYMTENPPQPSDEQANAGVDAYMTENGQDYVNTYMGENAQSAVNTYMDVNAQSKVNTYMEENAQEHMDTYMEQNAQNKVDDYLERNPLQLDNTLTDPTKAAPADKVGEIGTEVDELKGDIADFDNRYLDAIGNLFPNDYIVNGKYIDINNGNIADANNYSYCEKYIKVEPNTTYSVSNLALITGYDSNKEYVCGYQINTGSYGYKLFTSENTHFIRCSFLTENKDTFGIFKGKTSYFSLKHKDVFKNIHLPKDNILTIHVKPYPYDNLVDIFKNYQGYIIVLESGTYDIIRDYKAYYGEDYFETYEDYDSGEVGMGAGLPLKNGTKVICSPNAKILCHYDGANKKVTDNFSAFSCGNGYEIDGMWLECSGIRYAIHDDFNDLSSKPYSVIVRNCHLVNDNQVIGGGLGICGNYLFENNYIEATTMWYDMRYHNNEQPSKNRMTFTGNYFAQMPRIANYGLSAEHTTECFFSNNCMKNDILHDNESPQYTTENIVIYEWNTAKHN